MRIRWTKHARRRAEERGISRRAAEITLQKPDRTYRDRDLFVAERKTDRGNILRVYYRFAEDSRGSYVLIITLYRTRAWGRGRR